MPGRTSFNNTVLTPLPQNLDPAALINLFHDHSYIIHTQPLVTRFSPQQTPKDDGNTHDSSGNIDKDGSITYDVWEEIPVLPFGLWSKEIHFTASFRDTSSGVQTRVDAPMGFVSEASYVVRRFESGDKKEFPSTRDASVSAAAGGSSVGRGEWVLEEKIRSQCNFVFKPFVQATMVPVRRKMHEGMIARVMKDQKGTASSGGGGNGV